MYKLSNFIFILAFSILCSCNNDQNSTKDVSNDTAFINELTVKWNNYMAKQDLSSIATLYAEQASLYGASMSKEQLISKKQDFFKKYPDFNQSITSQIIISKVTDFMYKASFTKRTTYNGHTSDVNGYLIFEKMSETWKITNESDDITDKHLSKEASVKKAQQATCIDIVMQILTTSPAYLNKTKGLYDAIVKNGGTSFGISIEGSPNPEKDQALDFSETYDFSLHETYSDHMPVIARYTFNPKDEQLYEYDIAEDKLNPINFDRSLLTKWNEICQ